MYTTKNVNVSLNDIIAMEASMAPMVQKAKDELVAKIRATPVPGVTPLGGKCFTMNAKTLFAGKPWSAEYYSADSQADIVEKSLASVSSATSLKKRLTEMLAAKAVHFNKNTYSLNDVTLKIIAGAIG